MTSELQEPADRTVELAETLGLSAREFAEMFGGSWTENEAEDWHDFDSDPSGGDGWPATPWMISGAPPQLMVRVLHHGVFLARPQGVWTHGVTGLAYQPSEQEYVSRHELAERGAEVATGLLRRRRRGFRYCHFCHRHTPPELRDADDVCMACSERWLGLVH